MELHRIAAYPAHFDCGLSSAVAHAWPVVVWPLCPGGGGWRASVCFRPHSSGGGGTSPHLAFRPQTKKKEENGGGWGGASPPTLPT